MLGSPLQFGPIQEARFLERPNRFLVRCRVSQRKVVEAFLPNPGRLWELLFPDVKLYLTSSAQTGRAASATRKTTHTVIAVEREGAPVFLHTHLTNRVARALIEERRIPELADARVVRPEITVGRSRFDFLLRQRNRDVYLEVKSCTLFGNDVAMFPDAVTERGRRHLQELAELRRQGIRSYVLFLVQTPRARWFMPDYHTDLAFSQTLLEVRRQVTILPVSIEWKSDLTLGPEIKTLEIPWGYLRREVKDRGSYLLLLQLDTNKTIQVGRLGRLEFSEGFHVYVGSAMRNLTARVDRHCRLRKRLHWHIDYLRQHADRCWALPIRSSMRLECEISHAMAEVFSSGPRGFGSSDCGCPTHLFWHATSPLEHRPFHEVLQRFRMRTPRD